MASFFGARPKGFEPSIYPVTGDCVRPATPRPQCRYCIKFERQEQREKAPRQKPERPNQTNQTKLELETDKKSSAHPFVRATERGDGVIRLNQTACRHAPMREPLPCEDIRRAP